MPQPAEVVNASAQAIAIYRASADRLHAEQQRILAGIARNPGLWRRGDRVAELLVAVEAEISFLRAPTRSYAQRVLPAIYGRGGVDSGLVQGDWTWSQFHRGAIAEIIRSDYAEVARALAVLDADAAQWVRSTSRALTASAVLEGRTPDEVARAMRKVAPNVIGRDGIARPLAGTIYRNGTKMPLGPYLQMLIRTQTALAYNLGTLNTVLDAGVLYVEILDGNECGLNGHDDTVKANGRIMLATEAITYPISHPNCRRAFAPRPDITNAREARLARGRVAGSVVDDGALIDQAVSEALGSRPGPEPFTSVDALAAGVVPRRGGRAVRRARVPRIPRGS